ncbi:MAG: hypothetical protein HDS78_05130 [Bacteroidales bacterium]|nr:hypothetical protein [Bacteroidales bacterium]
MNKKVMIAAVVAAVALAAVLYLSFTKPEKHTDVREGWVSKIETMAQLCTVDLYSEMPILDTINNKVMFAIQKQRGSISFDLENLKIDADGDTVKITLSPEIVELYEATEPNSWEVIDTKAIGRLAVFRSDRFSDTEENALKARIQEKSKRQLYRNGTVRRARAEGAQNLRSLMEQLYRKPVVVTDPTPQGAHYDRYK